MVVWVEGTANCGITFFSGKEVDIVDGFLFAVRRYFLETDAAVFRRVFVDSV